LTKKKSGTDLSNNHFRKILKRITDITGASILIMLLSPFWLLIAIIIKTDSPGSIIFKQIRLGVGDKEFYMYKFRTMREGTPDVPIQDHNNLDMQITKSGRFLRRFSIDEWTQLINIVKGDMSFVGPRPSHRGQIEQIEIRRELGINKVKPGLTGYAAVNGRDALSIREKAEFDKIYVFGYKPFMDTAIVLKTLWVVVTFFGGN
jgi:O-antigen biosynthesis protein WbqP